MILTGVIAREMPVVKFGGAAVCGTIFIPGNVNGVTREKTACFKGKDAGSNLLPSLWRGVDGVLGSSIGGEELVGAVGVHEPLVSTGFGLTGTPLAITTASLGTTGWGALISKPQTGSFDGSQ
mmetsp:Transcript_90512/g.156938  ORF Transcript_90512/g.156938 Transcript_90512/m.156938 type:complete len:123 (+) Transcript_90512:1137-1505(+)